MTIATRQRPTLASVVSKGVSLPDRIVLYADPGWGKSSFAARLPKPVFLTTPGENRLDKLIEQGLIPETPHFPDEAQSWDEVTAAIDELIRGQHDYRTFVLDTGNGAERLAQEQVCQADYNGDWGEHGFQSFSKGEKITANRLWFPLLQHLDDLRGKRKMRVVILCHTAIRSTKNPDGLDFDKIVPSLSKPSWEYTSKWADMILRGSFESTAQKDNPKNKFDKLKGKGGRVRLLYTSPAASFEAKNCHRLPHQIRLGDDPFSAYDAFRAAFPPPTPKPSMAVNNDNLPSVAEPAPSA